MNKKSINERYSGMRFSENEYKLKTCFLLPTCIVLEENCENTAVFLKESPRQAYLGHCEVAVIKVGGCVILDFGREIQGGIDFTIREASKNAKLRVVFGESVSETMSRIGEKNATNDHSARDTVVDITNWQHFRFGNTGFRFVKLEPVNCYVHIAGIQAAWEYYDAEYKGSFECNDELINQIWETGAHTVHLNMNEYLMEGAKRDRLVWIGDFHPEVSTLYKVFGDVDVVEKSLDLIRDVTPPNVWVNGIASYTLWWLIIQWDWYYFTGKSEFLLKQKEYLVQTIKNVLQTVDDKGVCNVANKFVEWSSKGTNTIEAGYQSVLAIALDLSAKICNVMQEYDLESICKKTANSVRKVKYPYKDNKQIAAMTALSGINDIYQVCNEILIPDGGKGLATFWGYYTLKTLGEANHMQEALDIMKEYWGAMLKVGATSFWEHFDLEWLENSARIDEPVPEGKKDIHGDFGEHCYEGFRNSLCHGWASGPTAFCSEYVLGIKICEPGCKKVKIEPQLGNLEWAKGSYPTPFGCIEVEHRKTGDKIKSDIKLPEGVELLK